MANEEASSTPMRLPRVDESLLKEFPQLKDGAARLDALLQRFEQLTLEPLQFGDRTARGLSWRCQAIARANLLRGNELLRHAIHALNNGDILAAYVLTRALYETLAFVVFARREIERTTMKNDPKALTKCIERLTCGNSIKSKSDSNWPKPYHINDVLRDAAKYLDEYLPEHLRSESAVFTDDYDIKSEFAHPNQGSFSIYQRLTSTGYEFTRDAPRKPEVFSQLISALCMTSYFLLQEADALEAMRDLPPAWPSKKLQKEEPEEDNT